MQLTSVLHKLVGEGVPVVTVLTLLRAPGKFPSSEHQHVQTGSITVILHSSEDHSVLADAREVVSARGRQTKPKVYGGFSDFKFVSFTDLRLQTVWIVL